MQNVKLQFKIQNDLKLEGERIYLRPVKVSNATQEYVGWLNDSEVNQFLESRFVFATIESVKGYIHKVSEDPDTIFLAIMRKDTSRHIGNIKLGPIDRNHHVGDIGIMIGDKNSWGKGFATEAIGLLEKYAFQSLKLHKLTAGAYAENIGSIKAFLKQGFVEEGRRKEQVFFNGKYIDAVFLGKINQTER